LSKLAQPDKTFRKWPTWPNMAKHA